MKKVTFVLMLAIVLGLMLSACTSNKDVKEEATIEASLPAKEMIDEMIAQVEQPSLMELDDEMIQQLYRLDPNLLEDYSIRMPMMNVKTNEIAILKVKDAKDIATVEAAIKQRALDIQKQFETYLPDQYENAKNYKLITKGNYLLFLISESTDDLVKEYDSFFVQK